MSFSIVPCARIKPWRTRMLHIDSSASPSTAKSSPSLSLAICSATSSLAPPSLAIPARLDGNGGASSQVEAAARHKVTSL